MNNFDMSTQLEAINFYNTHDTLCVPKGMTLKQLVEDYDRLNNIIDELEECLKYWLKLSEENKNMSNYTIYSNVLDILKELKEGK